MSFEHLFDFYKDFSIFPDIITLIQMKTIFNTLSETLENDTIKINFSNKSRGIFVFKYENCVVNNSFIDMTMNKSLHEENENKIMKTFPKKDLINYHLFLESLAITAMKFKFNEKFSDLDKVNYRDK